MKRLLITVGLVFVFLAGISIFRDMIIKSVGINTATRIIGAPVRVDGFSMDIFSSAIHITGFKIYNPSGFPEGVLVSCPKINIIFDRGSVFQQNPHFQLVEVELGEMVLTKNKEGKLNVDSLKIVHPPKSSVPVLLKIDLLNLSIGEIVYKDYTSGPVPSVRVYDINRSQSYKRIPTAQQLALLVLSEPMKAATIKDAEIYGVAMLTGVAMLPVAVIATFTSQDSVRQSIDAGIGKVYDISLVVIKSMGVITKEDKFEGVIKADIKGSAVAIILRKDGDNKTEITISARKYMFPEFDVAGGILYQILDKL